MQNNRLIDNVPNRPDAAVEVLRELDPELPDLCWRIISGYRPNRPTTAWSVVRLFVIQCVISMKPRTHANARRFMTLTALYTTWVWTVTGGELTARRVFTETLVQRYVAQRLATHSENYRFDTTRYLAAIGEQLTGERIQRMRIPEQSGRVQPYSPNQEATLYSWANTLPTPLKRQNARAFLGLAGGAGLTALELMAVRVEDVALDGERASVTVRGDQQRRVPVQSKWVRTLRKSVGNRTSGNMFHAYRLEEYPPRELQRFFSDNPCTPRPSAGRLHSGWVVAQIDAGLPLDVLLEVTGFSTTKSLQPYLAYAKKHHVDDYLARITGEEVA